MPSLHLPTASSSGVSAVALRLQQRPPTRLFPSFNPLRLAPNPLISPKRRATISSHQSPSSPLLYGFQIRGSKAPFTAASSYPTSPGSVSGDSEVDKAKLAQVLSIFLYKIYRLIERRMSMSMSVFVTGGKEIREDFKILQEAGEHWFLGAACFNSCGGCHSILLHCCHWETHFTCYFLCNC